MKVMFCCSASCLSRINCSFLGARIPRCNDLQCACQNDLNFFKTAVFHVSIFARSRIFNVNIDHNVAFAHREAATTQCDPGATAVLQPYEHFDFPCGFQCRSECRRRRDGLRIGNKATSGGYLAKGGGGQDGGTQTKSAKPV